MNAIITKEQIQLFKSIFKGREDVFAIRWEKGSKSGYMPAYFFDPYLLRAHKISGGTFQNYTDKRYLPFMDTEIEKHINGEKLIVADEIIACMRELADKRCLSTSSLQPQGLSPQNNPAEAGYSCVKPNMHAALAEALFEAYLSGFIVFKK